MTGRFPEIPARIVVTLENIERIVDHEFQNTLLLWQALQGVRIPLPGFTDGNAFPDGNRRLALLGRFAIGLAFTENVNSGAKDAESLEKVVRKFGWSSCLRYVGEKMGLEKIFASGDTSSKGFEGESTIDMTVRSIFGAVYLDASMSGVQKTLGHWDEILADVEKGGPEEVSGLGWLDVVMGRKDEDEGSKSGGDKANPDV